MRASSIGRMLFFIVGLLLLSAAALAQVQITVAFGPPPIPVYEQPICPGDGYMWVPGYWAWDNDFDDYFWVPGTWVLAPEVGYLWTPPWWGWDGGVFLFHTGFWGPVVGFYGGINYGFGYFGEGFVGGRWDSGRFYYNRSVTNVNVTVIRNVYNEHVEIRNESRVSFNGGHGGIDRRPTAAEEAAGNQRRMGPIAAQEQHMQTARGNPELRADTNHGKPSVAATPRAGEFGGSGVVAAHKAGGSYNRPAGTGGGGSHGANAGARPATHPNELQPLNRPETGNTSSKEEQNYQKQQQKLYQQQAKDRQKLQQQQEKEHAQMQKQNANDAQRQAMEQRHQQQTQQMAERHQTQTREMQSKQPGGQKPK